MRTSNRDGRAFTLIELLIVVAIIAILALIAVPNFLEAQARAKTSRAMADLRSMVVAHQAYIVDWNDCLRDWNDSDWSAAVKNQMGFVQENPGTNPDLLFVGTSYPLDTSDWMPRFYSKIAFRPLTTPVAYITSVGNDSFSHMVPIGMDTREEPARTYVYWVLLCAGPDRDDGDWFRGNNPETRTAEHPDGMAIPYDPTNGTVSSGDIWRGEQFVSTHHWYREYGPWPIAPAK